MLHFLIFLYVCAFKFSCSAELRYFITSGSGSPISWTSPFAHQWVSGVFYFSHLYMNLRSDINLSYANSIDPDQRRRLLRRLIWAAFYKNFVQTQLS